MNGTTSRFIRIRAIASAVLIFSLALLAMPAYAQSTQGPFIFTVQIPGLPNGGVYLATSFSWGPSADSTGQGVSNELTFTSAADISDPAIVNAAQSKQVFATAELQDNFGFPNSNPTTVADIQMTNVRILSVRIKADAYGPVYAPQKIVTLKFDSVVYTFQPYLPNGQKNGPPVTFTVNFKKAP